MGPNDARCIVWALGEFFFLFLHFLVLLYIQVLNYGKQLPCHLHTTDIVHNDKQQAVRINDGQWGQMTQTSREDMKKKKAQEMSTTSLGLYTDLQSAATPSKDPTMTKKGLKMCQTCLEPR